MAGLDKKGLSERDICTKFITPAVKEMGDGVLSCIARQLASYNERDKIQSEG